MSRRDRSERAEQSDRTAHSAGQRRSDITSAPAPLPLPSIRANKNSIVAYRLRRNLPRNFPAVGYLSGPTASLKGWRGRRHVRAGTEESNTKGTEKSSQSAQRRKNTCISFSVISAISSLWLLRWKLLVAVLPRLKTHPQSPVPYIHTRRDSPHRLALRLTERASNGGRSCCDAGKRIRDREGI